MGSRGKVHTFKTEHRYQIWLWLMDAIKRGDTHLIIVHDMLQEPKDWPVRVKQTDKVRDVILKCNTTALGWVSEVYDLRLSIERQLKVECAFNTKQDPSRSGGYHTLRP